MRLANVSVQVDVEVDWSNVNVMLPVPGLVFAGVSLVPSKVAVHWITLPAAWAG